MSSCGISSSATAASSFPRSVGRRRRRSPFPPSRARQILLLRACLVERALRAAEAAFAVCHHRQVHVGAADAAVGTEFAERLGVVSGGVGGQAHGLADGGDAAAAAARGEGVLEGELWFDVDQASGHDEVAGHPLAALSSRS